MPQFDTSFFASQIFWTILSFSLLFVVLKQWILPRIEKVLDARTQVIAKELKEAEQKNQHFQTLKERYTEKLENIDHDVKKAFKQSEKELRVHQAELSQEWEQQKKRKEKIFAEDMAVQRQQMTRELRLQSAELVVDATAKIIQQKIGSAEAQASIDQVIDDLAQAHETQSPDKTTQK